MFENWRDIPAIGGTANLSAAGILLLMGSSLEVPVPETLKNTLELAGYSTETLSAEARRALAAYLYKRHTLSLAQAAELAQQSIREFIVFLASIDIPVLDYPPGELDHDEASIEWQLRQSNR